MGFYNPINRQTLMSPLTFLSQALAANAKMVDFGGLKGMRAKLYSRLAQILQVGTCILLHG